ncbi:MAG: carbamoyltransferase [Candidatus Chisholmbacteria bacterium]|nr:carbamoyltransferase [Candidatus Chisholmbacteria bacterium]
MKRPVYILGISCFYHDAAAALLKDGKIIAAAHEERFTRIRHDQSFPEKSVQFCLDYAGIEAGEFNAVAFYDKPFLKFERLLTTYVETWPRGVFSFLPAMREWLTKKLWIKSLIYDELPEYEGEIYYPEHHVSHAASAFLPSPFNRAAILTMDGVGEWATATKGLGDGTNMKLTHEITFPHSLGLLYSAFTYYLGFKVNSAEYKVMGLAPYGKPKYAKKILDDMIEVKLDGSFKMNMKYFAYPYALKMTSEAFDDFFGASPRPLGFKPTQEEMDIAASIQAVTDEIMVRMARDLYKTYKVPNLTMAGGVALNCVSNGKILTKTPMKNLFVQPAAGDAGGSVGAALYVYHQLRAKREGRREEKHWAWETCNLGPEFSNTEILKSLRQKRLKFKRLARGELVKKTVQLIKDQAVVGWFQGRMEFGPRALGNRSILADARNAENQKRVNLAIKFRESFRPFAPVVIEEKTREWFEASWADPYMLTVAQVKKKGIPAVTHVDNSARIQTVNRNQNPLYYDVVKEFGKQTGVPVLINTSFNRRGEPIVCTPEDALMCFLGTNMDYLVMAPFILDKKDMPMRLINKAKNMKFAGD